MQTKKFAAKLTGLETFERSMDSAALREAKASRQPPEAQPAASAAPGAHQCVLDLWIDGLLDTNREQWVQGFAQLTVCQCCERSRAVCDRRARSARDEECGLPGGASYIASNDWLDY